MTRRNSNFFVTTACRPTWRNNKRQGVRTGPQPQLRSGQCPIRVRARLRSMLSFVPSDVRYEPYRLIVLRPAMDQALYDELTRTFPSGEFYGTGWSVRGGICLLIFGSIGARSLSSSPMSRRILVTVRARSFGFAGCSDCS